MKIVDDVPQPIVDHGILELAGAHAVTEACFLKVIGRHAHVLHAAGYHHIGVTGLDRLGGQHDGFQRGTAYFVDGDAFCFPGHAGLDRCLLGRVLAIAAGKDLAHEHFVYFAFPDTGPFDRFLDHDGPQVRGADGGQRSVETAQRCSHRADNDCFVHINSPELLRVQGFEGSRARGKAGRSSSF